MRLACRRIADRIDVQHHILEAKPLPKPRQHHNLFGIDIRPGKAHCLDIELMKLPIAPFLRTLVTKHRAPGPDALRAVVKQVVLDGGTYQACRRFRPQRELFAVHRILKRIHFLLDNIGHFTDRAHEQRRRLDNRRAHQGVTILLEYRAGRVFEKLPQRRIVRQQIVHAADGLQGFAHVMR